MNKNNDFRASTLFPVFDAIGVINQINFLSYWKFKNKLENVSMSLSLFDSDGVLLNTKEIEILGNPRTYEINLNSLIKTVNKDNKLGFNNYVEVEVFFEKEPFIKYPALVLSIKDESHSSVVHSCLRNFNPNENINENIVKPDQTGFDIYPREDIENYLIFIGGEIQEEYKLEIEIFNSKNSSIGYKSFELQNNSNKKLFNINLSNIIQELPSNNSGSYKVIIRHDIQDVFPRFYVGNYSNNSLPTLTHTFFDENNFDEDLKISNDIDINKLAASFMFPLFDTSKFITSISSYMANKAWSGKAHLKAFDKKGVLLKEVVFDNEEFTKFQKINKTNINSFIDSNELGIDEVFCKFELYSLQFPARFKLGLNIGYLNQEANGTNICFSPPIYSKNMEDKPTSSSWAPIGGLSNFEVYFHNVSMLNKHEHNDLQVFVFSNDGKKIIIDYELKPDSTIILSTFRNKRIRDFLKGSLGYVFFKSKNPFFSSWYLSVGNKGIGGDHSF